MPWECKGEWDVAQFSGNSKFSGEDCHSSTYSDKSKHRGIELTLE